MSLLIKGADISPDHMQCITVFPEGFAVVEEYEWLLPIKTMKCEVASVPTPHGRLIDADTLKCLMYHEAFESDSILQKWDSGCWIRYKMFENALEDTPTIIEAEE